MSKRQTEETFCPGTNYYVHYTQALKHNYTCIYFSMQRKFCQECADARDNTYHQFCQWLHAMFKGGKRTDAQMEELTQRDTQAANSPGEDAPRLGTALPYRPSPQLSFLPCLHQQTLYRFIDSLYTSHSVH